MWNFIIILFAVLIYCYRSTFFHIVDPVSYKVNLPDALDGNLQSNDLLDKVEKLHENAIHWPESMAERNGYIYTGLGDGRIVRISDGKVHEVSRTGMECEGQHEEHICGRPLGMQFNKQGVLHVVDAYHGLFTINVESGKKKNILPSSTVVEGKHLTFLNSLTLDEKENVIYLTQSSTKWNLSMVIVSILEHESSGRLLKYDIKSKQTSVLLKDISFPNGVKITHDGSALLVAEGNKNRIFKYHIAGPRKGQREDLPLVLPGEPDNLSYSGRGNYWVGVSSARTKDTPALYEKFAEQPLLRRAFLYMHKILTAPISASLKLLPYKWTKELSFELQTARILPDLIKVHGVIIEFDDKGRIVQSLHSPSGKIAHISEVLEHNGYLYLGSWRNRYLGKVKL